MELLNIYESGAQAGASLRIRSGQAEDKYCHMPGLAGTGPTKGHP